MREDINGSNSLVWSGDRLAFAQSNKRQYWEIRLLADG